MEFRAMRLGMVRYQDRHVGGRVRLELRTSLLRLTQAMQLLAVKRSQIRLVGKNEIPAMVT